MVNITVFRNYYTTIFFSCKYILSAIFAQYRHFASAYADNMLLICLQKIKCTMESVKLSHSAFHYMVNFLRSIPNLIPIFDKDHIFSPLSHSSSLYFLNSSIAGLPLGVKPQFPAGSQSRNGRSICSSHFHQQIPRHQDSFLKVSTKASR